MKRTKKQKNSIILGFTITIIIFIVSIFYIAYNFFPIISSIEKKKNDVFNIQEKIKSTKIEWLKYDVFKSLSTELSLKNNINNSTYLKKLLLKTDEKFYKNNFINTGSISYNQFLKNKDIEISKALEKASIGLEKDINKILPNYSSTPLSYWNENILTDFKFINYLEELFNWFNLEYKWGLGISNLQNYYKWDDDLDTSIFYISLSFNLDWKKKDIINFIHYFENVWYIKIIWNKLKLQKDYFIPKNTIFSWNNKDNYNIYNNQIADISYIKIPKYLDSSYIPRDKSTSFTSFIKNDITQSDENINVNIGIRFYTRGIANYIIKKQVNLILNNFNGLSKNIIKKLKDPKIVKSKNSKDILFINKLKKLNNTISWFQKNISLIRKKINKKWEDLNALYKESLKYNKVIDKSLVLMWRVIYVKKNK